MTIPPQAYIAFVSLLIVAAATIVLAAYRTVRLSRPILEGVISAPALEEPVTVERDAQGVPTIRASNRMDAAFATGFVHAQERFFQMDVSRRIGAGELSEIFGRHPLEVDRVLRPHQFRQRAHAALARLDSDSRRLLARYTEGVNAGLKALAGRPFELAFLQVQPVPWREEDTLLVAYSLFVILQDCRCDQKLHTQALFEALPEPMARFIAAVSDPDWDAPLRGKPIAPEPIPGPEVFTTAGLAPLRGWPDCEPEPKSFMNGSNAFAVSGKDTPHGAAIVANDMHLLFGMPNAFFRAAIEYFDRDGIRRVSGFTIPGYPLVVAGSNGRVAWGLTNSPADWGDLILLEQDQPGAQNFKTPQGVERLEDRTETILIKDEKPEQLRVRLTRWGPVVREDDRQRLYAHRWAAHMPDAVNLDMRELEKTESVREALAIAPRCGIPGLNFVAGDKDGHIGWTITGKIPRRAACTRVPIPSSQVNEWQGTLAPEEHPAIHDPEGGRIWSANARAVDGEDLEKLGFGHYILGARARQIRDGLFAKSMLDEQDLLDIQRDNRAIFLERWRDLLLETLLGLERRPDYVELRNIVENWSARASAQDGGYRAVRCFRAAMIDLVFEPIAIEVRKHLKSFQLSELGDHIEAPLWALVSKRPAHLTPAGFDTWDAALARAVEAVARHLRKKGGIRKQRWGHFNRLAMHHPFSMALPFLGRWLDMRPAPLDGDLHMPLSQTSGHGPVQRMVVAPGHESKGIAHLAGGQASNPQSPYFGAGHREWLTGTPSPFAPEAAKYRLHFEPEESETVAAVEESAVPIVLAEAGR